MTLILPKITGLFVLTLYFDITFPFLSFLVRIKWYKSTESHSPFRTTRIRDSESSSGSSVSEQVSIPQFSLAGKLPGHMFAIKVSVPHRLTANSLLHLGHISKGNSPRQDLQDIFGGSSDIGISHNGIHVNYEFIHSFFYPGLPLKFQRSPSKMQFDPFWKGESSLVTPFETN